MFVIQKSKNRKSNRILCKKAIEFFVKSNGILCKNVLKFFVKSIGILCKKVNSSNKCSL